MLVTISRGGSASTEPLEQPQPLAIDLVVHDALAGRVFAFPGGKLFGGDVGEQRQVVAEVVDVVHVRTDDDQRRRGVANQRGRHQRAA